MTTYLISPNPKFHQDKADGTPASGYKLFTYAAGTTSKLATYTSSTGMTPNTNPVILDSLGNADVWLPLGILFKLVFSPPTDTDPPTNSVWTVDNLQGSGSSAPVEQSIEIDWSISGKPAASQQLPVPLAQNILFPANFTGSTNYIMIAPTSNLPIVLQHLVSGTLTNFGTLTFPSGLSGAGVGTFSSSGTIALSGGDVIVPLWPAMQDSTGATMGFTLIGTAD